MGQNGAMTALLLAAVLLANAPFVFARFLGWGANKQQRPVYLIAELLIAYGIFVVIGRALEAHYGQNAPQAWQFYAVSFCLFLSMAFPGFVWRYLLKK